jgi:hypothetical protein
VTSIGDGAFAGCSSLSAIEVDAGNAQYCSVNGILFSKDGKTLVAYPAGRRAATYIIPAGVSSIGNWAFYGCDSLSAIEVDAGNAQYRSVNGILFSKDGKTLVAYPAGRKAATYTIPAGVTSIGTSAFSWCSRLTSVSIPTSVTSIGNNAFYRCDKLSSGDKEAIRRRFGDRVF